LQEYGVIENRRLMLGDRERDGGALTRAYTIGNLGSKTVFNEDGTNSKLDVTIQRFDDFQENLLRNYSLYKDSIHKARSLTVGQ
jgi:hypothetical protein